MRKRAKGDEGEQEFYQSCAVISELSIKQGREKKSRFQDLFFPIWAFSSEMQQADGGGAKTQFNGKADLVCEPTNPVPKHPNPRRNQPQALPAGQELPCKPWWEGEKGVSKRDKHTSGN